MNGLITYDSVLVQVYATLLAGVLILRLFEWKDHLEEESSQLMQLRAKAIVEKEAAEAALRNHERS